MYSVKVYDEDSAQWRDVSCIREDYHGHCHAWSDHASEHPTLVEAFELADGLWFHSDGKTRSGVFDAAQELVYDTAQPIDMRRHPAFEVMPEAAWVDAFGTASSTVRPGVTPEAAVTEARALFGENRHEDPWDVVWTLARQQPLPMPFPRREKSLVQLGHDPADD